MVHWLLSHNSMVSVGLRLKAVDSRIKEHNNSEIYLRKTNDSKSDINITVSSVQNKYVDNNVMPICGNVPALPGLLSQF